MIKDALKRLGLTLHRFDQRIALYRERGWRKLVALEWTTKPSSLGVSLDIDNGPEWCASVRVPFAGVWLSLPASRAAHDRWVARARDVGARSYEGVEIVDVSVHDGAIWWSLVHPDGSWSSGTPRWRNGSFRPIDALLGEARYSSETLSTHDVQIPMPEGTYDWTVKLTRATWRRSRWPRPLTVYRAECESRDGECIPIPGKGEDAWNCGDDAISALCAPARTVEEAIGQVVSSVLRSRMRYGGSHVFTSGGKYAAQEAA